MKYKKIPLIGLTPNQAIFSYQGISDSKKMRVNIEHHNESNDQEHWHYIRIESRILQFYRKINLLNLNILKQPTKKRVKIIHVGSSRRQKGATENTKSSKLLYSHITICPP